MNTYKLGNKITCVIRAYSSGKIGDVTMTYDNQPYTILRDVTANISFADIEKRSKDNFTQLFYNDSKINKIDISDVVTNDKILNLIFDKSETKLFTKVENYESDNKILYLNKPVNTIYQVFVYNTDQELVFAKGTYTNDTISVDEDGNYLVCYQYEGTKAVSLSKPNNQYYTLDLLVTGNKDDDTKTMTIHIEKCGLKIDKSMYFSQNSNTVNLSFTVVETNEDYITLE